MKRKMVNLYLFSWHVFLLATYPTMEECLKKKAFIEKGEYYSDFKAECIWTEESGKGLPEEDKEIRERPDVYFADLPTL